MYALCFLGYGFGKKIFCDDDAFEQLKLTQIGLFSFSLTRIPSPFPYLSLTSPTPPPPFPRACLPALALPAE